jgi:hypothetical protein
MRLSLGMTGGWIALAALVLWTGSDAQAQDSSTQSLGDVARKTRKEHASASHMPAKQVTNEEEDGPDAGGVWRVTQCSPTPCFELSIALPKSPKWIRPAAEPRPVLIPLPGHEEDLSRAIHVYAAEALGNYFSLDLGKRTFLQGLFARPDYFGQAARIVLDEHVMIDSRYATITHFTVISAGNKYRGLSIVAGALNGNFGFACVFREEDASAAASICDAIVKSARTQSLQPVPPRVYPDPPQYYPRYHDPADDPPEDPE